MSPLERRYRRWLTLYPRSFRELHEEEMIAVLMQGADDGQNHPTPGEASNLAAQGLRQYGRRIRNRFPSDWERQHSRVMFPIRVLIALWLCFLSAVLIGYDLGQWWLLLLIPSILAHVYIAYQIRPGAGQRARRV